MKDSTAWLLTSAMEDVVASGTGTAARISNSGIAEAGKTGTTNEYKDLWFVGYTPYYTAGIWLGYDNSVSMRGRISSSYSEHKVLWKNIMDDVLEGYESRDFYMPDDVEKATICSKSGLLASGRGCTPITEYFATDSLPDEYCSSHIAVSICSECGLRATSQTPDDYVYTKYFNSYSSIPDGYCYHTAKETETEETTESTTNESESTTDKPTTDNPTTGGTTDDGNTDDGGDGGDGGDDDEDDDD